MSILQKNVWQDAVRPVSREHIAIKCALDAVHREHIASPTEGGHIFLHREHIKEHIMLKNPKNV